MDSATFGQSQTRCIPRVSILCAYIKQTAEWYWPSHLTLNERGTGGKCQTIPLRIITHILSLNPWVSWTFTGGLVKVKEICSYIPSEQPLSCSFPLIHGYSTLSHGGANMSGISEVIMGSWTSIISVLCKPFYVCFLCTWRIRSHQLYKRRADIVHVTEINTLLLPASQHSHGINMYFHWRI